MIQTLGEMIGATAGFWGWGRGNPIDSAVTPVAALQFGMTPDQWRIAIEHSLSPEGDRLWSRPIRERMKERPHVTVSRDMLVSDEVWQSEPYRAALVRNDMDEMLASVHYYQNDCWFHVAYVRRPGIVKFNADEVAIVALAMENIAWLQPRAGDALPPEAFVGLTSRQRVVMLLLLDGQSRKQIAAQLQISLHTVNDHAKAIFDHFNIQSVSQLAARFLQSQ